MNQSDVWNAIGGKWSEFRNVPIPLVAEFLGDNHGRILDLACGSGRHFSALNKDVELHGLDISIKQIELAKMKADSLGINANLSVFDVSNILPYPNDYFDSAIFISAIHCIDSAAGRENSLKELFRVLKPGSEALITAWDKHVTDSDNREVFKNWNIDNNAYKRYYYLFTKEELVNLVKSVGFEITKVYPKISDNPDFESFVRRNIILLVRKS